MIARLLGGARYADGQHVTVGDIALRLRVNPRARRISLRVTAAGEAVATAPSARRLPEAVAFAEARREWLASRLARRPEARVFTPGAALPFAGRVLTLMQVAGASAARLGDDGATLIAGGDEAGFARRVERWLRDRARAALTERTALHAGRLGVPAPTVTLGDPRGRWGSCSPRGAIRYSWRLILSPPEVLDYVAAHEVAHLAEPNHSPRFWAVVDRLYGDPASAKRWLKANGAALHAWGQPTRRSG